MLKETHVKMGYGGRDKMPHQIDQHYFWIQSKIINSFLPAFASCQVRKPLKLLGIPNAIISLDFVTRLQLDFIDMQTRSNGEMKWISHFHDHFTKFSWEYSVPTKEARYERICCAKLSRI
jgi:hypothetical protein